MPAALMRQLEILRAVIEAGGATEAAQRLGLSQPAVSQQIARLEKRLGLDLFTRAHGRLIPTETALALYDEARHAFDGLDRVMALARDVRGLDFGLIRIAAPHSLATRRLPRALAALAQGRPELRFTVHLGTYERIVGLVAAREADLGVAKAPLMHPGLGTAPICDSPMVAVTAVGSALSMRDRLGLADLALGPMVMIGRGRPWRDEIDAVFRRHGFAMRIAVETQSVAAACGFVAAGFGVAVAPAWIAEDCAGPAVALRPLDIPVVHRFVVAHAAGATAASAAEALAAALRGA